MKYLLIVLMLFPVAVTVQKNNVFKLNTKIARTTKFASGWIAPSVTIIVKGRVSGWAWKL